MEPNTNWVCTQSKKRMFIVRLGVDSSHAFWVKLQSPRKGIVQALLESSWKALRP